MESPQRFQSQGETQSDFSCWEAHCIWGTCCRESKPESGKLRRAVGLGPPRSRNRDRIKRAKVLLGETPVSFCGRSWKRLGEPADRDASLTMSKGEREGWGGGDGVLDGCVFLGRFGKAVRESLSCNLPPQGHVSPRNGSVSPLLRQ